MPDQHRTFVRLLFGARLGIWHLSPTSSERTQCGYWIGRGASYVTVAPGDPDPERVCKRCAPGQGRS